MCLSSLFLIVLMLFTLVYIYFRICDITVISIPVCITLNNKTITHSYSM